LSNRPPEGLSLVFYALKPVRGDLERNPITLGCALWIARRFDNIIGRATETARWVRETRQISHREVFCEFDIAPAEARRICRRFAHLRIGESDSLAYHPAPELISFLRDDPRARPWSGMDGKLLGIEPAPVAGKIKRKWWGGVDPPAAEPVASIGLGDRLARRRNG
jgi:hypothetical protein